MGKGKEKEDLSSSSPSADLAVIDVNTSITNVRNPNPNVNSNEFAEFREDCESSPLTSASWLKRLFFAQVDPVLRTGYKRQLQPEDMYHLAGEN